MRDDFVFQSFDSKLVLDEISGCWIAHGICEIVVNGRMTLQKFASVL